MDGDVPQPECRTCRELLKRLDVIESKLAAAVKKIAEQAETIELLLKNNDDLRRGGKRQASPFSKGRPKPEPKKPGRMVCGWRNSSPKEWWLASVSAFWPR